MSTQSLTEPVMIVREADAGGFARVNCSFRSAFGLDHEALAAEPLLAWIHPEDQPVLEEMLRVGSGCALARHRTASGAWVQLEWTIRSEPSGPSALGRVPMPQGASKEEAPRGLEGSRDESISNTLEAMVRVIEQMNPGMKCSVLLLEEGGRQFSVGAGPSLPAEYNEAVDGLEIGPSVGSCGTATYWGVPVIVEDIQRDPLWRNLREYAARAGLGACWSHPIADRGGNVMGALALYAPRPRGPEPEEFESLKTASRLMGLAVERARAELKLHVSEGEARSQSRLLGDVTRVLTDFMDSGDLAAAGAELVRSARELSGSEIGFLGVLEGDALRLVSHQGPGWDGDELPLVRGIEFERLRAGGEPLCVHAQFAELFERGLPLMRQLDDESGQESSGLELLGLPISLGGAVVGLIGLAGGSWPDAQAVVARLELLSHTAGALLDSHRRAQREKSLEAQLRQAAKLEALGLLAGGVAHDFNNMLAAVMGNAELAQLELTEQGGHSEHLDQIISASTRAAELCNQMLAYAGRSVPSTELLECNDEIAELSELLRVTLSKKATLVYELSDEPLSVEADRTQIRQVIMNLITNAAEALGELEGRVVVATSVRVYDEQELEFLRPEAQLPAGEYVVVRVSDDGEGMTPEVQARIFDPFFTTKLTGRGLGLAVVRGIVDGHGGAIELQSEGGVGTSFTVILPRVGIVSPTVELSSEQRSPSAGQRILVVDDERSVREVMGRILVRGGFEVLYAAGGAQAIEIFKAESGRIDGVLLDLSMPQLDGEQTFNALRSIRSDVPVLLCSGYTEREVLARFRGSGLTGALQKPVATELLLRKVGEAVGGGAPMQPSRPWQAARPS